MNWIWRNEETTPEFPSKLNTFLLIEGFTHSVLDFFNSILFKGQAPICHLSVGHVSVYDFPEQKLAICVADEKDLNYFTPITEALQPWMNAADSVYAVTFNSSSNYKGEQRAETMDGCFVRAVNSPFEYVKELEVPNIVTGVTAATISYCKFTKKSAASCFVIFLEVPLFDSITAKPIIRLLKDLKIPCADNYVYKHKETSSLYL